MMVSNKANQIGESPTFKVTAKAKAMKAEGIDVIDLSVGEPDFPTPENIKEAGIKAIRDNFTKYTPIGGIPALKKAVAGRLKEDCGLDYKPSEIIISSGAKSSLYHLIQALINPGDEVIIPSPYWVTYPHSVNLAEGKPVIVQTKEENGFLLTPEQLKASITPSTKALLLNNPSNPTGAAYTRQQLEALAEIILDEDITVIADEIYEKLVYDDFKFASFASLGEEIKKKTAVINGVSKAYAMTGWRIGYTAAPEEIINAMDRIQGHTTSNANTIAQMASLEALNGPQYEISRMVAEFQRRRNYMQMRLQSIPDVSCYKSQGAFYLFPNFSAYYNKEFNGHPIRNSYGLAYFLLMEANVAIVSGEAFGNDNYLRFSYANSMENLEKGIDRIAASLSRLKTARKVKRIALNNAVTRVTGSIPVESTLSLQMRDALIAEMESSLSYANYFEWNANINGVIIQLRTNVPHLNDFWVENWYPAQLEADLEPHGIIYAVDGIPGREPRVFYSRESQTGILVNTDNYGPLRSLAIGLVSDISSRLFQVNTVRGMSGDIDGLGFILIGPKGSKKTELFFTLLKKEAIRLHANDVVFVRFSGNVPMADSAERKLFVPTQAVAAYSPLAPLFDGCKCENVVLRKEECRNETCLATDDCRLDRGSPFCYDASKKAYAMLDPYWLDGPTKHIKRTTLSRIFLLRNDRVSPPLVKAETEDALRILETGESLGARIDISASAPAVFFNPHLLDHSSDNMDGQRQFYRRLLNSTSCYLFNSGAASAEDLFQIISGK
ncbi:MAG: aminotransferase class I/II-fold pyridoxal phosphate-dependent enzyme [Acidobacteria bacterium]|nr:aminotransferase class I/II-fold pyridoxal phosphate-dependent enzyme [Acidobacteriota bacterium]